MQKFFFIIGLILIAESSLFSGLEKKDDFIGILPERYSFLVYCHSLDQTFKEFKDSYFWKKYKLTDKGKAFDKMLDSINGSFLVIGLVLDDLLQIFSQQAVLAVWLKDNSVEDYLYLIEKKDNKTKINSLVERLEYFAYANKIELSKSMSQGFQVYNFHDKIYMADQESILLISNDPEKMSAVQKKWKEKEKEQDVLDIKSYFKNNSIILYLKKTNQKYRDNDDYYYSFRFQNKPRLEGLIKARDESLTNARIDPQCSQFLPDSLNFLCSLGQENIRDLLYPFFTMISTNIYQMDQDYFNGYFDPLDEFTGLSGLCAIQRTSKNTNMLLVLDRNQKNNDVRISYSSLTNGSKPVEVLGQIPVYQDRRFFSFFNGFLLISNNLSFLKKGVGGFLKRTGFQYGSRFSQVKNIINKDLFLWMDLTDYVTALALKNGADKWYYYNAYIKTFSHFSLYGNKKNGFLYMDGSF